jgi:glycosyltransferase involved in cell wall biosynthesis
MSSADLSRVNLVVNIRFPGPRAHGIQVAAMAEALAATGLNVDVVVPRRFPYRDADTWGHYGVRHTFGVQRLASFDTIDLFPPRLQRLPFLVQTVTFAWRALARSAVERDAGIVVRDHYTLAILLRGLRTPDQARVAAEVHSLPGPGPRREQALALLRRVPAVIVISEALRDDLLAAGVDGSAILVARDGVHLSRFAGLPDAVTARRHLHLPERPTIVYAGQLYPWKGVDTLIEAMAHLPEAQLLVVGGDAQHLPRVVGLAQRVAPGRVHFAGTVPHAAVPFHLSGGDVIALPNSGREEISARFTSPLKLFEAMASRRPIVASDLPSLREVLGHDRDAVLVAPDDPAALAAGIAALLADPARGRRLAAAAREEVSGFDWSERGRAVATFLRRRLTVRGAR